MSQRTRPRASLIALLIVAAASTAGAQATLRPVPRVAHSWSDREDPRFAPPRGPAIEARAIEAGFDLGFIGPPRLERSAPSVQGLERERTGGESRGFVDVDFYLLGIGGAQYADAPGELATQRGGWKAAFGSFRPGGMSYAVEIGTEASFYDFGGGLSPVAGVADPFNDVYDTSLSGRFLFQRSERLEVYGGAQFGLAGEDRSSLSDSVYIGGALAMRYRAADEFALLAGIAGVSRFEDTPWILPYIGFDWQVSDSLRVLTEAAEVHVDWRVSEDWTLGAVTAYDFRQYRLNPEGPLNGGAFRDEEIRLGGSLGWRALEQVEFQLELGTLLWRETLFVDGQSGERVEAETGSPLYLRAGLSLSF